MVWGRVENMKSYLCPFCLFISVKKKKKASSTGKKYKTLMYYEQI